MFYKKGESELLLPPQSLTHIVSRAQFDGQWTGAAQPRMCILHFHLQSCIATCTPQLPMLAEGARASAATFRKHHRLSAGAACENSSIAEPPGDIGIVLENRQSSIASILMQQMPLSIAAARSHI